MSYIGVKPISGSFQKLDSLTSSFNGTTTTFNLTVNSGTSINAGKATNTIISLNNVILEPNVAYQINSNQIVFATAPAASTPFFGVVLGNVNVTEVGVPSDASITTAKINSALLLAGAQGGTGVANTGKTITLGGNLTTSGANAITFTTTGTTNLTLPTSGTVLASTNSLTLGGNLTTSGAFTSTFTMTGVTSVTFPTSGTLLSTAAVVTGAQGGTGVANSGKTITLGGNFATSGAFNATLTLTADSTVTLPTSGTLLSTAASVTAGQGGTGQSTYTIGDILYASGTTALSKLAGVATGNALISGGVGTAPSWGKVGLTTHVSGILPGANGGTGVANTGKVITLGGDLTTSGANAITFTTTGSTNVTLPTSGTLLASTFALSLAGNLTTSGAFSSTFTMTGTTSVTFPTSGTLLSTAAVVTGAQGGTGVNNGSSTITLGGNFATSGAFATTLTVTGTTNVTLPTSGTLLSTAASVTAGQGGTGQSTYTTGDMLYASGTSAISKLAIGTNGYVLSSTGSAPAWTQRKRTYDFFQKGVFTSSAFINGYPMTEACQIPANAAGSAAQATVAATAGMVVNIRKCAAGTTTLTTIGTMTWSAAGTAPTFATTGGTAQSLAVGDLLFLESGTADSTLANVGVSILVNIT